MARLACVDVPALPLQLLLRRHPDWADWPVAVVDEDKPQGLVLWANEKARRAGVLPGVRYGAGLSLVPSLRAAPISPLSIQEGIDDLLARLYGFSPAVEPSSREPGVFWLDADGFEGLFQAPGAWAQAIREGLSLAGYVAAVVVGFRRFGTYAVAKLLKGRRAVVFETPERETAASRGVPLALIGIPPKVRDALSRLGVTEVAHFVALPGAGLLRRFGPEAYELYRFATDPLDVPLAPTHPEVPVSESQQLDYGETNSERLVFAIKPVLDSLLTRLGARALALAGLDVRLELDGAPDRLDRIRPAEPTLSSVTVLELVKLKLDAAPLEKPAIALTLTARAQPATDEQLAFFAQAPRRDRAAVARAFARLRASYGEHAVVRAVPRDRHSPEARCAFEPLAHLEVAHPRPAPQATLVRRIHHRPPPLPMLSKSGLGWLIQGPASGSLEQASGPYRLTGGWWRHEIQRDYYFVETHEGELLWIYFDRLQGRWFLQGEIE